MIICHCYGLSDRDVRRAASETDLPPFSGRPSACQLAGTACGGCRPLIDAIRREAAERVMAEGEPVLVHG